jgi:hypothetical protein
MMPLRLPNICKQNAPPKDLQIIRVPPECVAFAGVPLSRRWITEQRRPVLFAAGDGHEMKRLPCRWNRLDVRDAGAPANSPGRAVSRVRLSRTFFHIPGIRRIHVLTY